MVQKNILYNLVLTRASYLEIEFLTKKNVQYLLINLLQTAQKGGSASLDCRKLCARDATYFDDIYKLISINIYIYIYIENNIFSTSLKVPNPPFELSGVGL